MRVTGTTRKFHIIVTTYTGCCATMLRPSRQLNRVGRWPRRGARRDRALYFKYGAAPSRNKHESVDRHAKVFHTGGANYPLPSSSPLTPIDSEPDSMVSKQNSLCK
jgi:hypothetical protein